MSDLTIAELVASRTVELFRGTSVATLAARKLVPVGRAITRPGYRDALDDEEREAVAAGLAGIELIGKGTPASELAPEQIVGMQLLVALTVRPSLRIRNGEIAGPFPREWDTLETADATLTSAIRGVGRISYGARQPGTGFLVRRDLVMTNRHVVREIASRDPAGIWQVHADVAIDFVAEGNGQAASHAIVAVRDVHPQLDVAVLEITPSERDELLFASRSPVNARVAVIGCPGKPRSADNYAFDVLWRLFDNTFNVKRLSPGYVTRVDSATGDLEHDASTLGGSSGSPLVDIADGLVVGIHHSGHANAPNHAALPTHRDRFFSSYGMFS